MNRIVVFPSERTQKNAFLVGGERLAHMRDVLGLREGGRLRLAVVGEGLGEGRVARLGREGALVEARPPFSRPALPGVALLAALVRPQTAGRVLEYGACMGVRSFTFFRAERSQRSYGGSRAFGGGAVRRRLVRGMAQGGRVFELPSVEVLDLGAAALVSGGGLPRAARRILLSPGAPRSLAEAARGPPAAAAGADAALLALGPEGGWTPGEEEALVGAGFVPASVSPHVLRTEAAAVAGLALLGAALEAGSPRP